MGDHVTRNLPHTAGFLSILHLFSHFTLKGDLLTKPYCNYENILVIYTSSHTFNFVLIL